MPHTAPEHVGGPKRRGSLGALSADRSAARAAACRLRLTPHALRPHHAHITPASRLDAAARPPLDSQGEGEGAGEGQGSPTSRLGRTPARDAYRLVAMPRPKPGDLRRPPATSGDLRRELPCTSGASSLGEEDVVARPAVGRDEGRGGKAIVRVMVGRVHVHHDARGWLVARADLERALEAPASKGGGARAGEGRT